MQNKIVIALFLLAQFCMFMALNNVEKRSAALEQCLKLEDSRTCYRNLFNNAGK